MRACKDPAFGVRLAGPEGHVRLTSVCVVMRRTSCNARICAPTNAIRRGRESRRCGTRDWASTPHREHIDLVFHPTHRARGSVCCASSQRGDLGTRVVKRQRGSARKPRVCHTACTVHLVALTGAPRVGAVTKPSGRRCHPSAARPPCLAGEVHEGMLTAGSRMVHESPWMHCG